MVLNKIFGKKNSTSDIDSLKERFSKISSNQDVQNPNAVPPSVDQPQESLQVQDALGNPMQSEPLAPQSATNQVPPQQPQNQAQPLFGQQPLGMAPHMSQPSPSMQQQPPPQQPQEQFPQQNEPIQSPPVQPTPMTTSPAPKEEPNIDLPSWAVESTGEEIANEISEQATQAPTQNKATQTLEQIEDKYYDAKLNSLIIDQVKELIEIDNNLNTKIEDISSEMKKEITEREKLATKVDQHFDKVKELERNMEKFLGLYEMVTNQFNPFVDKGANDLFLDQKDKPYDNPVVQDPNTSAAQEALQFTPPLQSPLLQEPLPNTTPPPQQQPAMQKAPPRATIPQDQSSQWTYCPIHHNIHPSLHFQLKNGQKLSSIYDVLAVLEQMDEETFVHHVNLQQNDISDWVYRVLGLTDLGQQLQLIKTRPEMISSVRSYIQEKMKSANQ